MGAVATFDYNSWLMRYPEFSNVTAPVAQEYFNEASLYHANDGSGPVCDVGVQLTLLNMLTAHVAIINSGTATDPPSPIVGRISSANEGSVSVNADLEGDGIDPYFAQTKYGLSYWRATAAYRQARYRAGPRRRFQPLFTGDIGGLGC